MSTPLQTSRFTGTIEPLGKVNVAQHAKWIASIPEAEYTGMYDMAWHEWGDRLKPLADKIVKEHYPGCRVTGHMLGLMEPGLVHPPHTDEQADDWLVRIHVPLLTNSKVTFETDDGEYHLDVGKAYKVNTTRTHRIENLGKTPRIHFIFDVRQ